MYHSFPFYLEYTGVQCNCLLVNIADVEVFHFQRTGRYGEQHPSDFPSTAFLIIAIVLLTDCIEGPVAWKPLTIPDVESCVEH